MANFSKKLASTVSAAAIVATSMSASLVSAASEFLPYAEALASKNVINKQTAESGYRLNDQITRAELAKVAANLGGYTAVKCTGAVYADVNSSLGDLCDAIETLAAAKVISTSTNKFRPTANVTRAEMTKMILGALAVAPVSTASHKFADVNNLGDLEGFINSAVEKGVVNKATNFRPNATGSRGEVFKIAAKAAGIEVTGTTNDNKTETKAGKASVSLVGQAVAQEVPRNVVAHEVATIKVSANDGDVNLSSLLVARSGLGTSNGLEMALVANGVVISENVSVNNTNQTANISLTNPVVIKNGTSAEFKVIATLNPSVGLDENNRHQFSLVGVNGENLTTPLTLGLFATTTYEVAAITVNDIVGYKGVKAGQNTKILDVSLTSPSNRETTVTGFTLTKTAGSNLTEAISNVKVLVDGKDTGAKAVVTADKIIVTGLSQDLTFSQTAKFTLTADVIYVNNSDTTKLGNYGTFTFNVNRSVDVSGKEKGTMYNLRVANAGKSGTLEIQGLTVKVTPESTTTKNISLGDEGTFLDATLTSTVPFTLKAFDLIPTLIMNSGDAPELNKVFEYLTLTVDGKAYEIVRANTASSTAGVKYDNLTTGTSIRFTQAGTTSTNQVASGYFKDNNSNKAQNHEVAANTPLRVTLKGKLLNANTTTDAHGNLKSDTNAPVNKLDSFKPVFRTLVIQPKNVNTDVVFIQDLAGDRYKINDFSDVFKSVTVGALTNGYDRVFAKYTFDVQGNKKVLVKKLKTTATTGVDHITDFTKLVQNVGNNTNAQNVSQYYRVRISNGNTSGSGAVYNGTVTLAQAASTNDVMIFDFTQGAAELLPGKNTIELLVDANVDTTLNNKYLQVETELTDVVYENSTSSLTVGAQKSNKIMVNKFAAPSISTSIERALKSVDLITKKFKLSIQNNENRDLEVKKIKGHIFTKADVTVTPSTDKICLSLKENNNECDVNNADTLVGTITAVGTSQKAYTVEFDINGAQATITNLHEVFKKIEKNKTSNEVNLLLTDGLRNTLMSDENVTISLSTVDYNDVTGETLAKPFSVTFTR